MTKLSSVVHQSSGEVALQVDSEKMTMLPITKMIREASVSRLDTLLEDGSSQHRTPEQSEIDQQDAYVLTLRSVAKLPTLRLDSASIIWSVVRSTKVGQ